MQQDIQSGLNFLSNVIGGAPDALVAAIVLALAAAIGLSIHSTIVRLLRRPIGERHPRIQSFLARTTSLTRFGVLVLALFIALPATPLDPDTKATIVQILALASIILAGWTAIALVNTTADLYLARLAITGADNLLARKHLTQIRVLTGTVNTLLTVATVGVALTTFEPLRQFGLSLFGPELPELSPVSRRGRS